MYKSLQKKEKGFTIIEVLIVLAIAGLIMLIVFLAVPALQRNQRNSSRRSDIGRIGSSATEFITNNNGTLPSTAADATAIQNAAGTLSQYTGTYLTIQPVTGTTTAITNINNMRLVTGAKCATNGTVTATGASARSMS